MCSGKSDRPQSLTRFGDITMLWLKFGWRNLWRNRRRSLIELTSIAGSIFLAIFMNNLAKGSYSQMIDDGVKMGSGHIGLYRHGYLELRKSDLTFPTDTVLDELEALPEVSSVYPRLHVPGLIKSSRESRSTIVMGLDFARELATNPILKAENISEGEIPSDDDSRGALVGSVLADELGLKVGKKFVIMAQDANGEIASRLYRITGLVTTNAKMIDAAMVLVPRKFLGDFIGAENGAHEVAVMFDSYKTIDSVMPKIESIAAGLGGDVAAFRWEKAMPDIANAIKMDYVGFEIMIVFMYLIVTIGTINTLLMSVMERTREFGVIRAIGLNKSGIRKIVVTEALVLGLAGVVLGTLLATLVCTYTYTHGIDYSFAIKDKGLAGTLVDPVIYSTFDWPTMTKLAFGMIGLAVLASLYPAHYVLKIRPADAMRKY